VQRISLDSWETPPHPSILVLPHLPTHNNKNITGNRLCDIPILFELLDK
jgi:hypothetical protein